MAGAEAERQRLFGEFLLRVGDGKEPTLPDVEGGYIRLPDDVVEPSGTLKGLIDWVYRDLSANYTDPSYFAKHAILTLKNLDVDSINDIVMQAFPGEVYLCLLDSVLHD